ncbi:M48 family metallopeptidase [Ferribacterium limneticum]|uniref:M48 family metallopeptidase n=1 Tax=Ferribacterium limneticum TaxID=76259 RepID=UPI001CF9F3FF|nr:M48 family metallopeptidase [Ferribacterium limneticum]UCV30101.1 M48 family metallopeptidase [Ferribacterium limneticum]UCV34020.1 M48 family metallopeptidase [Ferribacterium limneticum]
MKGIAASYYDGRTPLRQSAELLAIGDEIVARGAFGERRARCAEVEISEPMGRSPRFVRFADGGTFEVADLEGFSRWLMAAGFNDDSLVVRMQKHWSWALGSLLGAVLLIAAIYVWGLPAFGKMLAPRIPEPVLQALSAQTLGVLDGKLLAPSRLSEARRAELTRYADQLLQAGANLPAHRLHFRSSALGPNAFALPSGDVVVFDQLVELAENDDEVAGVIAHELGHVAYRHGVRQLIQSSLVSFVVGIYFGDVSSMAASLGAVALESRYSREFEHEADAYAARTMLAAGRGTEPLAAMLDRMEKTHAAKRGAASRWDVLSSHPDTAERIARLRAMR